MLIASPIRALEASSDINQILDLYKKPLVLVESLRLETARHDYQTMVSLCLCFDKPLPLLIKQLRNDMRSVELVIKKEGADLCNLYGQLRDLCTYLKKHKVIYNAILIHNDIKKSYQQLFDMIDQNEDIIAYIQEHRNAFGLEESCNNYLSLFLKKVKIASRQISKIEDYVHTDYVDLKMQNYVFKIELVKLRNTILFDNRYKNR